MNAIIHKNGADGRSDYLLQWLDGDASDSPGPSETPAEDENDQGFAARLYHLCLFALRYFYRQERDKPPRSRAINLGESLGRLYLWGDSFSVGELDRALSQSEDLKENVLEQLGHIGKLLLRELLPSTKIREGDTHVAKQIEQLDSVVMQATLIVPGTRDEASQYDEDSGVAYDTDRDSSSDNGSFDFCEDIGFATTCLAELRPSLEQNLSCGQKSRLESVCPPPASFCLSDPAKVYVSLVKEKYQQAPTQLVERLGEANWQRHLRVRKRMENINSNIEEDISSVFRPNSAFHDSGIGTSVPPQTLYAESHTSFISSNNEGDSYSLRVPPMPTEVNLGKSFQCQLCGQRLTRIKNRIDWKMHVFADLQPYICTFANCEDELAQFSSRAAWSDHEFSKHRVDRQWSCPECLQETNRPKDWEDHLQQDHQRVFSRPNLQAALRMAENIQESPTENESCPLCRIVLGKPRRAFFKHVGRHMEEIALMSLPRNTEEDSDEGSTSAEEDSLRPAAIGTPTTAKHKQTIPDMQSSSHPGSKMHSDLAHDNRDLSSSNSTSTGKLLESSVKESSKGNFIEKIAESPQQDWEQQSLQKCVMCKMTRFGLERRRGPEGDLLLCRSCGQDYGEFLEYAKQLTVTKNPRNISKSMADGIDFREVQPKEPPGDLHNPPADRCYSLISKDRTSDYNNPSSEKPIEQTIESKKPHNVEKTDAGSFPQNPQAGPDEQVEHYRIKCICSNPNDDGNTVWCERCDTWQHTQCYYVNRYGITISLQQPQAHDHLCVDCNPRPLDIRGANKRQRDTPRYELWQHSQDLQHIEGRSLQNGTMIAESSKKTDPDLHPPLIPPFFYGEPKCDNISGFAFSGGLLRHQREVYHLQGSPRASYMCPHNGCNRSIGVGFSREDKMLEHLQRCHQPEPNDRQDRLGGDVVDGGGGDMVFNSDGDPSIFPRISSLSKRINDLEYKHPDSSYEHGTHPSLSRERHPTYGNSVFSEDQSVYRNNREDGDFADWLFEPDTVKEFMAAEDTAGGRSEGRKTRGVPDDYLDKAEETQSHIPLPASTGKDQGL